VARGSGSDRSHPDWDRLAHLIAAERGRRRWTVLDLAGRASLSERTIEHLESGVRRRYRDTTLGRIEDAFNWKPGTINRILSGNHVDQADGDALLERVVTRWPYLTDDERRSLVDLLETFTRRRH
jgi:transcriptional regulator with XRE-family HTH domain